MLKELKLLLLALDLSSLDKTASSQSIASAPSQDQEISQEKALACTKLLPDLQNLIAQYVSYGWKEHNRIKTDKDITSLSINTNDSNILTTSLENGITRLLDTKSGMTVGVYDDKYAYIKDFEAIKKGYTNLSQITSSNCHISNNFVGVVYDTNKCKIYFGPEQKIVMPARITCLQFSPGGHYLAIGSINNDGHDSSLKLYKIAQYRHSNYIKPIFIGNDFESKESVYHIVSQGHSNFIVATSFGIFKINIISGESEIFSNIGKEKLDDAVTNKLAITADGKYLAYSLNEKDKSIIKIIDLESKKIIETLQEDNIIKCFDFFGYFNNYHLAIGLAPKIIRNFPNSFSGTMQDLERKVKKQNEDIDQANQNTKNLKIWNLDLKEFSQNFNFEATVNCLKYAVGGDLFVGLNNGEIVQLKLIEDLPSE